jgi:hypothetical protein
VDALKSSMSDASAKKVLEWLAKEGFPLEVRVGKVCRAQGWLTYHGFPYKDPNEGKVRDCDVYASRFKRVYGSGTASVDLAIECKRSADKPWVVFAEPAKPHDWVLPSMLAPGKVSDLALGLCVPDSSKLDLLRPKEWVGYSVTKAHAGIKDGDPSGSYSALRAVMAAAEALQVECERSFTEHPDWPPSVDITLPVIVVGAPLYLYTIDSSDQEHLEAITSARVVAPQRHYESRCLLTIVAEAGFADWLVGLTAWADSILEDVAQRAHGVPGLVKQFRELEGEPNT